MIGPELQQAIFAALTSAEIAGGRVYDRPPAPEALVFPYVTIGDEQVIDDSNSCAAAWEVVDDVHVWSRPEAGSKFEAKTVLAGIVDALATELDVVGFVVVSGSLDTTRTFRDQDGITEHSVLTFRYLIDPA